MEVRAIRSTRLVKVAQVFKAAPIIEDTSAMIGQDVVSFGWDGSIFWGLTRL